MQNSEAFNAKKMIITKVQIAQITNWIWTQVKIHGLPYVLIIGGMVYLYVELQEVKRSNSECQNYIFEMYKENNTQMIKVIERNTEALKFKCQ